MIASNVDQATTRPIRSCLVSTIVSRDVAKSCLANILSIRTVPVQQVGWTTASQAHLLRSPAVSCAAPMLANTVALCGVRTQLSLMPPSVRQPARWPSGVLGRLKSLCS